MQTIIKGIGRLTAKFPPFDAIQASYEIHLASRSHTVRRGLPPIEKITANVIRMKPADARPMPEGYYELETDDRMIQLQHVGLTWHVVSPA